MSNRSNCSAPDGIFESRESLQISSHFFSLLVLPVNCWGIRCILRETPKMMKPVKRHLLNLHIWTTLFDVMCGSLLTPFFFFPALAGSPSGLLTHIGIPTLFQIFLAFCCFGGVCSAIIFVFENRQYVLGENTNKFRLENATVRTLYYSFVLAYCCLSVYPFLWNIPEQVTARLTVLKLIPCPNAEFFSENTYVFKTPEDTSAFAWFGLCFTVFLVSQISFFGGHCFYNLYSLENLTLSEYSKRLQKKLFISICIQIFIPMWVVILPLSFFLISIFFGFYSQSLNNLTTLLFSCHGFIATVCLLSMNPPYRKATLHKFLRILSVCAPQIRANFEKTPKRVTFVVSTVSR